MREFIVLLAILAMALSLAACDGGGEAEKPAASAASQPAAASGAGNAANGQKLFAQALLSGNAGCSACHSLEPDKILVGPSMAGIASRAGSTAPGESAEQYIRNSIIDPNAFLTKGCNAADPAAQCAAGLMPQDWQQKLTPEQLDDLVAYLLTLQ